MKLLIYCYPQWAFGQLHNGLAAELRHRGWEVTLLDWTTFQPALVAEANIPAFDRIMTVADGAPVLVDSYGIPRERITIVAHAEADIQSLIAAEGINTFYRYARYGVVGDSLACSSLAMGVPRIPTVLRVGVEWERFRRPISNSLKTVGYAARFSRLTNSGVEQKRGWLAEAVAKAAGLEFRAVENLSMEAMPGFYGSIDAYVFPSLMEASPLPPLEAAARGALVIGTPAGHFPRLAYEGLGILGPLNEEAFKEFAIDWLIYYRDRPEEYRDKCTEIQECAKDRYWSVIADDWEKFFQ